MIKRRLIVLVPILLLALGAAGYGIWSAREEARIERMSLEDARAAFHGGDHRSAFRAARRLAEAGIVDAQAMLGSLYFEGYGTETNHAEALNWYLRAADGDHQFSMTRVLYYYRSGDGLQSRNPRGAARWAERLAELGNLYGQIHIGNAYLRGDGVPKDRDKGIAWLQQAIDAGSTDAMLTLARAYRDHTLGAPEYEKALELYLKAGMNGEVGALVDVVWMQKDESLPVFDLEKSYFWALIGIAWAGERSIHPETLAIEIVEILYHVPDGIPHGFVNPSGLTGDGLSPDPSPLDYDPENWPRRLSLEAQRRVEADVQDMLARWPQPPMSD